MVPFERMRQDERKSRGQGNGVGFCEEKQRLVDTFLQTIHELNALQNQQIQAVIDGEPDFNRFDVLLFIAQQKKDRAKYEWISHVETHRCDEGGTPWR